MIASPFVSSLPPPLNCAPSPPTTTFPSGLSIHFPFPPGSTSARVSGNTSLYTSLVPTAGDGRTPWGSTLASRPVSSRRVQSGQV